MAGELWLSYPQLFLLHHLNIQQMGVHKQRLLQLIIGVESKFGSKNKSVSLDAESQVSAHWFSAAGCFTGEQYRGVSFCWDELQFHLKDMNYLKTI